MAMYKCCYCDSLLDDDWFPSADAGAYIPECLGECLCPDCVDDLIQGGEV